MKRDFSLISNIRYFKTVKEKVESWMKNHKCMGDKVKGGVQMWFGPVVVIGVWRITKGNGKTVSYLYSTSYITRVFFTCYIPSFQSKVGKPKEL